MKLPDKQQMEDNICTLNTTLCVCACVCVCVCVSFPSEHSTEHKKYLWI